MKTIPGFIPFSFQERSINIHREMLENNGGTFILDSTGLGKTITAATVAINATNNRILIICPAANKADWHQVMTASGHEFAICTSAKLIDSFFGVIIVDEAHNYRNIKSKSYLELFGLVKRTRPKMIMLSATIFQNKVSELKAVASLIHFKTNTPAFILLGSLFAVLKESEKELEKFERFTGTLENPKGGTFSYKSIGKHVELSHKVKGQLAQIAQVFATFSHRTTRKDIETNHMEAMELMGRFPKKEFKKISYGQAYSDVFYKTIELINRAPMVLQSIYNYMPENKDKDLLQMGGIMRSFLLKRLDSSVYAFRKSLVNAFLKLRAIVDQKGLSFITIDEEDIQVIPSFWKDYERDVTIFQEMIDLWKEKNDSEKTNLLFNELHGQKCIVFTEYKDTLDMLMLEASKRGISGVMCFSGASSDRDLEEIRLNLDANCNEQIDSFQYLFSTDVLAEGTNLHVARELIHFDQKWNPSRAEQRNGRIDRILKNGVSTDILISHFEVTPIVESILRLEKAIDRKMYLADTFYNNLVPMQFTTIPEFAHDRVLFFPNYPYSRACLNAYRTYCGDVLLYGGIIKFKGLSCDIVTDEGNFGKVKLLEKPTTADHIFGRSEYFGRSEEAASFLYKESYDELFKIWLAATIKDAGPISPALRSFKEWYRIDERERPLACTIWLKEHQYMDWY